MEKIGKEEDREKVLLPVRKHEQKFEQELSPKSNGTREATGNATEVTPILKEVLENDNRMEQQECSI